LVRFALTNKECVDDIHGDREVASTILAIRFSGKSEISASAGDGRSFRARAIGSEYPLCDLRATLVPQNSAHGRCGALFSDVQSAVGRARKLGRQVPIRLLTQTGHILLPAFAIVLLCASLHGQTASTGALTGRVLDASGAIVPGAAVQLRNFGSGESLSQISDNAGSFHFLLVAPGRYDVEVSRTGFARLLLPAVNVLVTETMRVDLRLQVGAVAETVEVSSQGSMLQTNSVALGRVVNQAAVSGLPLVTRNFAQIADLSPGVVTGVSNAGELGAGGTALSQIDKSNDGLFVHGARSYDNNFELDGISVSDVQGSALASGGIPLPNPDAIQEFKVQTGLYDASYGRYGGANISVVTKSGTDVFHGSAFEFLRNDVLNANDYFLNRTGQPRPPLKQNQFGFDVGGPIKRDKLFFFGSYQGTRQVNALASGQTRTGCTVSLSTPPITNDRSPAALGKLFGGMSGALGGVAVNADGSNINPVALELLNFKLPNGSYLIPTPQTLNSALPFASQGFSTLSQPCHYDEDQFLINIDYVRSALPFFVASKLEFPL
jgi:hypothetical protein